jgi:hypothetical protein
VPKEGMVPAARMALGFGQGLLLFLLYQALEHKFWPGTDPYVFLPLVFALLLVPIVAIVGLGNIPPATLRKWAAFLVVLIASLAVYAAYKYDAVARTADLESMGNSFGDVAARFFVFLVAAIFIGHTLLTTAASKGLTFYPGHFDLGWKHAIQIVAAALFTLAFWLLLVMGQALFKLVGLDPFKYFIGELWFIMPVTTLVVAISLHITDVRPAIIAGIRTLALTLLSWLLPILALITVAFLSVLPFTGLALLWDTGYASSLLLIVATALIVLINAVYQDGAAERAPGRVLRYAVGAAALALTPLALITAYALFLRIDQYGWTVARVLATTYAALVLGYAAGYGWAVLRKGPWMALLERCNVVMAFAITAVIVALLSPLADPERISVSSQVARLENGKASAENFDVMFLRFDTGRYGVAALEKLRDGGQIEDEAFKKRIVAALETQTRWLDAAARNDLGVPEDIEVLPHGKILPADFVGQDWNLIAREGAYVLPECMTGMKIICRALMIDLDTDTVDEVVVMSPDSRGAVFKRSADGLWSVTGYFSPRLGCENLLERMRQGAVEAAAPLWRDIVVDGLRLEFEPVGTADPCP